MRSTLRTARRGFMLMEAFTGPGVVLVLVALLLPAVQQVREAARKSQCQDHLHNIAIAMHDYEASYKRLPPGSCDGWGKDPDSRYSWALKILPFVEQKPLYDTITSQGADRDSEGLPDPGERQDDWNVDIDVFLCPSDAQPKQRDRSPALLNYKANVGDVLKDNTTDSRGLFGFRYGARFADVTDGLANTLFVCEMTVGYDDPRRIPGGVAVNVAESTPQACWDRADGQRLTGDVRSLFAHPGGRAWDGKSYYAFASTAVSPNGPACQSTGDDSGWGHLTPSSRHAGGSQVALGDARVSFISQNIDVGQRGAEAPDGTKQDLASPYGVWGGLGTRAGGENLRLR